MARVALPESRIRARRRRRRAVALCIVLAVLAVLVGGAAAASHAPFLRITDVVVDGVATVASSTVEAKVREELAGSYWRLFAKNNIFLYSQEHIRQALHRSYPQFKVVDVHANDFHTIGVVVVEREPKALWCPSSSSGPSGGACFYMDEDGVVYGHAPQFSGPIYIEYVGGAEAPLPFSYRGAEEFQSLSALVDALDTLVLDERVVRVVVDGEGDVRVRFESGFDMMFTLQDESGDVFERFSLALKAEPFAGRPVSAFLYLDLRFGDKLYYKLKGE